jgi:hypothetical protein
MIPARRGLTRWSIVSALSAWLLALPASAGPSECEARCASSLSPRAQSCIEKCPSLKKKSNRDEHQACSQRCSDSFKRDYDNCASKCGGKRVAADEGGKKAASGHHGHKKDNKKKDNKKRPQQQRRR